ncbi:MAG: phosphoribosylformylglycinamidine synthase subunit PurS [Bacteroidota bacterium]
MPTYHATIAITLRPSILDPEGKAVHQALQNLGQASVQKVRVGKRITLTIEAETKDAAYDVAETSCQKVLANPVTENYEIEIAAAAPSAA